MTDSQNPPTGTSGGPPVGGAPPASPPPASPPFDIMKCLGRLTLVDKILAIIGILVLVGWFSSGSMFWSYGFFKAWFPTLSFLGALAVVVLVILKGLDVHFLPPAIEKKAIAVASLIPVLGFLIGALTDFRQFLTMGGSIALAYISAMTYWKKHIPQFAPDSPADPSAPK